MVHGKVVVELPGVANPGKLVNDQADGGVRLGVNPLFAGLPASFNHLVGNGRGIDGP